MQQSLSPLPCIFVLLAGLFVAIFGLLYLHPYSNYQDILKIWATKNGYQLIHFQLRFPSVFAEGPFQFSSKAQRVYHIVVVDKAGNKKTGWARCGNVFLGSALDEIEVKWEEPATVTDVI